MNTEQKITKIVDGDTPSIEASVRQLGSTGALAISISDGSGNSIESFDEHNYKILVEYDANNNPIYVGSAEPSTATSSSNWQIKKITYDANNNPTAVEWADGNDSFDNEWDERTTYTYS